MSKLRSTLLVIIMTINAVMLIRVWILANTNAILRDTKATYILPDGYSPDKIKISWNESVPVPSGWAIRYAGSGCIFCKLDYEWEHLAAHLERLNYRTIILLPNVASKYDEVSIIPKNAKQMAFVKMDWLKQFRFIGTPTLIIFNNRGRVIWHRNGMLSEADYIAAKKAIENK